MRRSSGCRVPLALADMGARQRILRSRNLSVRAQTKTPRGAAAGGWPVPTDTGAVRRAGVPLDACGNLLQGRPSGPQTTPMTVPRMFTEIPCETRPLAARAGRGLMTPLEGARFGQSAEVSRGLGPTTVYGTTVKPGGWPIPRDCAGGGQWPRCRDWTSTAITGLNRSGSLFAGALARGGFASPRYDKRASGPRVGETMPVLVGTVSTQSHVDEFEGSGRPAGARRGCRHLCPAGSTRCERSPG